MGLLCRGVLLNSLFVCVSLGVCYCTQHRYLVLHCAILCSHQVHILWAIVSQVNVWVFPHGCHAPLVLQALLVCLFVQVCEICHLKCPGFLWIHHM